MDNIFIPSYNRSELVRTYEYLGTGHIIVPESQKKDYRKRYGDAVISIPDSQDGTVSRKKKNTLDLINTKSKDGIGWLIDDDLVSIIRKKENRKLNGEEALEKLEELYILMKDGEFTYSGFDYSGDNLKLKDMTPFSFNKIFFGAVLIDTKDKLRHDESFTICEDVDFYLQKLNNARKVLKDNQYFAKFYGEDGGKDSVIQYNRDMQKEFAKKLNHKWGYNAMVWKGKGFRFYNPIKGI